MLLTNFYNQKPKVTTKIIIQMLVVLIFADIVWIALFSGAWEHDNEEGKLKTPGEEHQFWESLWFIHIFVYVLAYLELILKGFLLYYLIADFKEKSKIKDLLTLNYDDSKNNPVTQSMDGDKMNIENSMVNESNNSFKEDFQNNF